MITVQEAIKIILQNTYLPSIASVSIHDAVGKVLAEPIKADRDFPPFDRVAMDGVAILHLQFANGKREFLIQSIQAAGQPATTLTSDSHCIEVMTGAILPKGTDTVIRYEDIEINNGNALIKLEEIVKGQHIHRKGQDAKAEDILVESGSVISPAEIALLATIGAENVKVKSLPNAAVVSSGNELVEIEKIPLLHQIRKSNTYALEAAMKKIGWNATQFHMTDELADIKHALKSILEVHDVVILSGGVSKGKFDFIPEALESLGVKRLFHQVSQRPGKPFWFGASAQGKIVFALPGNPVSTFMCFHRFVKPWLMASLGIADPESKAILTSDFSFEPRLTFFLQVSVRNVEGKLMATPQPGGGSGDFANLKEVDGFIELPLDKTIFKTGEAYPYIPFR
jgi:molybdopterin molybdotransferase